MRGRSAVGTLIVDPRHRSMLTRMKALKTAKGCWPGILGSGQHAPRYPHLGRGKASQGEKRQEGKPAVTSRRGCVSGTTP